jgi:UbiA prenyltransferase family
MQVGSTSLGTVVELLRVPAALTVPGDSLAGAAAARWPNGLATPAAGASAACLYWAGMALNDYADRHIDAVERPTRPIPSGRIAPRVAFGLAVGLTAAGIGIAGLAGRRRTLAVAMPLAATVWAYDLALKATPVGPVAMAAARSLDVLLGAGAGRLDAARPAALIVGAHTLVVSMLSRREIEGAGPWLPRATLAATVAVGAAAGFAGRRAPATHRLAGAGMLAVYGTTFGRAQLAAARNPAPEQMQRAVGAGILGMMPLQASLLAGRDSPRAAALVLAGFPLARHLSRRVSPT